MPRAPEPPVTSHDSLGTAAPRPLLALRLEDFGPHGQAASEDLRRRLCAWAQRAASRLGELGLELAVYLVDDANHPRALFLDARASPLAARPALSLGLDETGVRASLELPPAQVCAVRGRLSDPARALELSAALEALPEQFTVGLEATGSLLVAPHCGTDQLRALLTEVLATDRKLSVGWNVPREVAVAHAALLDEQLEDALAALARVYVLLTGEGEEGAATRGHKPAGQRGDRNRAARASVDDDRERTSHSAEPPKVRARAHPRDERRDHEADDDRDSDVYRAVPEAAAKLSRTADPRPSPRARLRRRPFGAKPSGPFAPIERGTRVRVLGGPFSGKVGLVQELDGKGGARVMLGLLAVRLEVTNVAPHNEGRTRPLLSTSHRKPVPVRS